MVKAVKPELLRQIFTGLLLMTLAACAPDEKQAEQKPPEKPVASASSPESATLPWKIPTSLPAGAQGASIQRGELLISQTAKYLGPEMSDPSKRIAGNHMACKNCHLNSGKQSNALGFVGITARFPQYRGRENREIKLEERINGCFERSLNGRYLSEDSPEMKDMLAYMQWLSQGISKGVKVKGQGIPKLELLDRAANPETGKVIYTSKCSVCHQPTGAGMATNVNDRSQGYIYPPLWGSDSFNNGAGMARVITAAQYIKANMPFGNATLTDAEAFDVAAYINSLQRPQKSGLENDFPDRGKKPVDAPFAPWPDNFTAQQHKYGPFRPMIKDS